MNKIIENLKIHLCLLQVSLDEIRDEVAKLEGLIDQVDNLDGQMIMVEDATDAQHVAPFVWCKHGLLNGCAECHKK